MRVTVRDSIRATIRVMYGFSEGLIRFYTGLRCCLLRAVSCLGSLGWGVQDFQRADGCRGLRFRV